MFSFFRIVTHTKPLDVWQYVQPLRYFSASSIKAKSPWSKDPETRREQYDKYNMLKREKYAHNKAFREKCTKGSRLAKQAMSDFDWLVYRRQNSFYNWVLRGLRSGAVRTWRTHTPEYSLVRETRCCSECGSYHNKRLWWKRKDAYNSYDCTVCFVKDWSRVHPIGYEHLTFTRDSVKNEQKSDMPSGETFNQFETPAESKP